MLKLSIPKTIVRPIDKKDELKVLELISRNRSYFEKGHLGNLPRTSESLDSWMQDFQKGKAVNYGVFAGKECLGLVGIQICRVGDMKEPAIASWYAFDELTKKTGLATASVKSALVDYLMTISHNLEHLCLHVHKTNKRSLKLAARLGFERAKDADYVRWNGTRGGVNLEGYTLPISKFLKYSMENSTNEQSSKTKLKIR